jgi:hypothetical protein
MRDRVNRPHRVQEEYSDDEKASNEQASQFLHIPHRRHQMHDASLHYHRQWQDQEHENDDLHCQNRENKDPLNHFEIGKSKNNAGTGILSARV